jgi:hypothetical protein
VPTEDERERWPLERGNTLPFETPLISPTTARQDITMWLAIHCDSCGLTAQSRAMKSPFGRVGYDAERIGVASGLRQAATSWLSGPGERMRQSERVAFSYIEKQEYIRIHNLVLASFDRLAWPSLPPIKCLTQSRAFLDNHHLRASYL